jgi:hypothetical protein
MVFPRTPAPVLLPAQVHPLVSFASFSEYVAACHLPGTVASTERLPWGLFSSSRCQQVESTKRRVSQAHLTFRPQRFSHSRRLAPPLTFAGLFHPTTASRIRSSGVFPATQPARLINELSPHVVYRKAPTTELPQWRQILPPRLQGVNPGSDP